MNRDRQSMRETIGEMLWPEQESKVQRHNISQALFSLRRQIEPPPLPSGSVILASQASLQLSPDLVETDVGDFEALITSANKSESGDDRIRLLKSAILVYKGDLLPGFFNEWVFPERQRLEDLFVCTLKDLIAECAKIRRWDDAILHAHMALAREPLDESLHLLLMRAFIQSERPNKAVQQYRHLKQLLEEHLQVEPSEEARKLVKEARLLPGSNSKGKLVTYEPASCDLPIELEQESYGIEVESPPITSSESRIPVQVTRFFGRQAELGRIEEKLLKNKARLISLLGPAGIGKTRLSVELSRRMVQEHGWTVWFVPLADVPQSALVLDTVASVLRVTRSGTGDVLQSIKATLSRPKTLLVLDNFEHRDEGAHGIVQTLLEEIAHFACIVTSRSKLRIDGEEELALDPLPVYEAQVDDPKMSSLKPPEAMMTASVQMFVDRCQSRRADFQVTSNNVSIITKICAQLEGIPLALELAAGLSNVLSLPQILNHLNERLTLLVSRKRDVANRHRSLHAAIDSSVEHLTPELRSLFCDLAVFRGGFTIDAASAVCLPDSVGQSLSEPGKFIGSCLSMLLDLEERSLVRPGDRVEDADAGLTLLETFRLYGEAQLGAARLQSLRKRHADYYLSRCRYGDAVWGANCDLGHIKSIRSEYSNHLSAVSYLLEGRRYEDCITLLVEMRQNWTHGSIRLAERSSVMELLRVPNVQESLTQVALCRLLCLGSIATRNSGEHSESRRLSEQALEIANKIGDNALISYAYSGLASASEYLGDPPADHMRLELKALDYAQLARNDALLSHVYNSLGTAQWRLGEHANAAHSFRLAFQHNPDSALPLYNIAYLQFSDGHEELALSNLGDAIRQCKRLDESFVMSLCYSLLCKYHLRRNNLPEALRLSHDVLMRRGVAATPHWVYTAILDHATILTRLGFFKVGTILLASAQNKIVARPGQELAQEAIEQARNALSTDEFNTCWAQGLVMDLTEAFDFAAKYR
jgi:predicted ATPase/DNA-binding SARP family transcriptional activator